ncbi:cupin domain-containing protein [Sedimenticola selenatireducens]|uniref:Cupin domain-containing protein n=1 Tax=Sedimenticola selenatireducens TaxID=191960 RepID=A0A558DP10_9GAMM|nr:cupin domain-containing protein [Sedimenticola selenatireducens]TVO78391.1 cupin domain-containing protein [Sedimenticola selenatireducens]TVT62750.1 MAG: cupin domain-containing protein [Sedimenticola selenatireducens]
MKTTYRDLLAYQTKDGSLIRELMHPGLHDVKNQSLAEAVIPPRVTTHLHRHLTSEEIYHITQGRGEMRLDDELFSVVSGDTILIPPGTPHAILNEGDIALHILCCCSPAYSHEDTELID